nr:YfjI family protein [uncultured Acidovorax sp.]
MLFLQYYRRKVDVTNLPQMLSSAVICAEWAVQCPVEIVLTSALSSLSLVCQSLIDVKMPTGMTCGVSLYTCVISKSGERKSGADKLFMEPVENFQRKLDGEREREIIVHNAMIDLWNARVRAVKKRIRQAADRNEDLTALQEELVAAYNAKPVAKRVPQWLYHNVTMEALQRNLAEVWPHACLTSSEGETIFSGHAMRHLGAVARFWDCPAMYRVDRVSSLPLVLKDVRLTLSLMTQREVFDRFAKKNNALAQHLGLLSRFLICEPFSRQGERVVMMEEHRSTEAVDRFNGRTKELLEASYQAVLNGKDRQVMTFTSGAAAKWRAMSLEIEEGLRPNGQFFNISGYASKIAENVARMAALFQYFCTGDTEIEEDTMDSAISVAAFYAAEFQEIFQAKEELKPEHYGVLLEDFLRKEDAKYEGGTDRINFSYLQQYGPKPLRVAEKLLIAIQQLADRSLVVLEIRDGGKKVVLLLSTFPRLRRPSQT